MASRTWVNFSLPIHNVTLSRRFHMFFFASQGQLNNFFSQIACKYYINIRIFVKLLTSLRVLTKTFHSVAERCMNFPKPEKNDVKLGSNDKINFISPWFIIPFICSFFIEHGSKSQGLMISSPVKFIASLRFVVYFWSSSGSFETTFLWISLHRAKNFI